MRRVVKALVAALLGCIVFHDGAEAAWPIYPYINAPLCTASGIQDQIVAVSDGAGGLIVAWEDNRSGTNYDIYANRVLADGTIAWGANGTAICTQTPGNQYSPCITSDGAGGAIIAWTDFRGANADIWAQRINAAGTTQWTANGVQLCNAAANQQTARVAADITGGAFVVWEDYRNGAGNIDIFAQHVTFSGSLLWGAAGQGIFTAAGIQLNPRPISDGVGGVLIACDGGGVRRLNGNGTNFGAWPAGGVGLSVASPWDIASDGAGGVVLAGGTSGIGAARLSGTNGAQLWGAGGSVATCNTFWTTFLGIVSDGAAGLILFQQWDGGSSIVCPLAGIYAQRIDGGGGIAPGWPRDLFGVRIASSTVADFNYPSRMVPDGLGGGIIAYAWQDPISGCGPCEDIVAARVTGDGHVAPGWSLAGTIVCSAPNRQYIPAIASDGAHGAVIAWQDERTPFGAPDVYAQRVERFGQLGDPAPRIVTVSDVRSDQGGQLLVRWNSSYLDTEGDQEIRSYWVWRQVPAALAVSALNEGALLWSADESGARAPSGESTVEHSGLLLASPENALTFYWEFVDSIPARGDPTYSLVVPTARDSVAGSNPYMAVMVEAQHSGSTAFWRSPPDSGYSVDNLAPPPPTPFTAAYASGATNLHWGVSSASDFASFRLYRGASADFVPGSGNLVVATTDTGHVDTGPAGSYYKLSAVDVHGNESNFATLGPDQTIGVTGPNPAPAFALHGVQPNPTRGEHLSVMFALPRTGRAQLEVFDVNGRLVLVREVGDLGAGQHTVDLGGGRRFAPGLYLVRLTQGAQSRTTRAAVLD